MSDLVDKMWSRRQHLGLTQEELATRAGYCVNTIIAWENERASWLDRLNDWCEALGVEIDLRPVADVPNNGKRPRRRRAAKR